MIYLNYFQSAYKYYEQCLEARENVYGHESEEVAITIFSMGRNAYLRSKTDESIQYFEEVQSMYYLMNLHRVSYKLSHLLTNSFSITLKGFEHTSKDPQHE